MPLQLSGPSGGLQSACHGLRANLTGPRSHKFSRSNRLSPMGLEIHALPLLEELQSRDPGDAVIQGAGSFSGIESVILPDPAVEADYVSYARIAVAKPFANR